MNKGNLLIVDDEPLLLKSLRAMLIDQADTIFTAENGKEALQVLDRETVHCIISDINMPVMNGVEMLKEIRTKNNLIPFIFFTAHGNHELMMEAVKYGAFDFLDKPNLVGIEEVVTRGLAEGTKKSAPEDDTAVESQYRQLLKQLKQE